MTVTQMIWTMTTATTTDDDGLKIIKDLKPRIEEHARETTGHFSLKYCLIPDESAYDNLQKVHLFPSTHVPDETQAKLEDFQKELDDAERSWASAIAKKTTAKGKAKKLERQVSKKDEKIQELSTDLEQRTWEIRLFKTMVKPGLAHGDPSSIPKDCGTSAILELWSANDCPNSRHTQMQREELEDSECLRVQVETDFEDVLRHANIELEQHMPTETHGHGHGAVDALSVLNQETERQLDYDTSNTDGTKLSRSSSAQDADQQVDSNPSNVDGAKPFISSRSPIHCHCSADISSTPNQKAKRQVDGNAYNANDIELSRTPTSQEVDRQVDDNTYNANTDGANSSLHLHSFSPAQRSYILNEKLIYVLSIIVMFITISIQFTLNSEKVGGDAGFRRPAWARHHGEGWQYLHGDSSKSGYEEIAAILKNTGSWLARCGWLTYHWNKEMTAAAEMKKSKSSGGKAVIHIQLWGKRRKARATREEGARAERGDKELRPVPVHKGGKYSSGRAEKCDEERPEEGGHAPAMMASSGTQRQWVGTGSLAGISRCTTCLPNSFCSHVAGNWQAASHRQTYPIGGNTLAKFGASLRKLHFTSQDRTCGTSQLRLEAPQEGHFFRAGYHVAEKLLCHHFAKVTFSPFVAGKFPWVMTKGLVWLKNSVTSRMLVQCQKMWNMIA
ncbi:hypothetical protein EI94DRAFT_1707227, partial [Lactarius quietus]